MPNWHVHAAALSALLLCSVASATGENPPADIGYPSGPPSLAPALTLTPLEKLQSAEITRRVLSGGELVHQDDPFLHQFPPPSSQGLQPPLSWQADALPPLPDGTYAEVVQADVMLAGAQRTTALRSWRYFDVSDGELSLIDIDAYSAEHLPESLDTDRFGLPVASTRGQLAAGSGPVVGSDPMVHSGHNPQQAPSNAESNED